MEERPGPVHLELPEDVAGEETDVPLVPPHPIELPVAPVLGFVERDESFFGITFAVNGEGDADAAEQHLGFAATIIENIGRDLAEPT